MTGIIDGLPYSTTDAEFLAQALAKGVLGSGDEFTLGFRDGKAFLELRGATYEISLRDLARRWIAAVAADLEEVTG